MGTPASAMRRENRRSKAPSSATASAFALGRVSVKAFLSCLAWLYVAGRLWQDAQTLAFLSGLHEKSSGMVTKVLSVEDKLRNLGCDAIGSNVVEAEMDLSKAKSEGYLWGNRTAAVDSDKKQKLLAVIGLYTGFGSRRKRNTFRGSWMPRGDALKKLEEKGVVIRFVIGRSANRGDSLDRNIDDENRETKDFLLLESHEEAAQELSSKAKFFFSVAVETWDAEFYVKVEDDINIDLAGLIEMLEGRRGSQGLYMGCMKSGVVINENAKFSRLQWYEPDCFRKKWYEPDWWKFGDSKTYFRHASGSLFILSKNLARYININRTSNADAGVGLHQTECDIWAEPFVIYTLDDITVGSWMMGLNATYVDDDRLCCSSSRQEKVCSNA